MLRSLQPISYAEPISSHRLMVRPWLWCLTANSQSIANEKKLGMYNIRKERKGVVYRTRLEQADSFRLAGNAATACDLPSRPNPRDEPPGKRSRLRRGSRRRFARPSA